MTFPPDPATPDGSLPALIERLSRLVLSEDWQGDLNPAQAAALGYLARANRFSRKPSLVADYLGATRGTVSQTLKALVRKSLVEERPDPSDRRSISYDVTAAGLEALKRKTSLEAALEAMSKADRAQLEVLLQSLLLKALARRQQKSFGVCRTCRHHMAEGATAHCSLLDVDLTPADAEKICAEHAARP